MKRSLPICGPRMGLTGLVLLGLGACGEVPTQGTDGGGIRVSVAAASTGFVQCGEEIPVTATVTDGKGKVLTGFLVNFRVLDGGGSMFAGSALTDNKGQARDYWTIGSGANLGNTLEVRAVDATTGDKNTYFTQTVTTLSKIAFASNRDGNFEIYVMNPDGTGLTRLTNSALEDNYPAWSPDGSRIAFAHGSYVLDTDIYVMNADGTGQTNLTNHSARDSRPAWSPDGRRIAFSSNRDGNSEIYVMNADGTAPVNLTNSPEAGDDWPTWSPDGSRIAFIRTGDDNSEIYVMKADGTGQTNLTNHPGTDYAPAWSPDGKKIAFTANHEGSPGVANIYVMNADGTEQTRLTNYAVEDRFPAWSPDGRKIASMLYYPYMQASIKVMNADGTAPTILTSGTTGNYNAFPAWSGCTVP